MVFGGTSRITSCVQPVFCRVHVSQDRSKCDPTFLRDKTGSGVRIYKKKKKAHHLWNTSSSKTLCPQGSKTSSNSMTTREQVFKYMSL